MFIWALWLILFDLLQFFYHIQFPYAFGFLSPKCLYGQSVFSYTNFMIFVLYLVFLNFSLYRRFSVSFFFLLFLFVFIFDWGFRQTLFCFEHLISIRFQTSNCKNVLTIGKDVVGILEDNNKILSVLFHLVIMIRHSHINIEIMIVYALLNNRDEERKEESKGNKTEHGERALEIVFVHLWIYCLFSRKIYRYAHSLVE